MPDHRSTQLAMLRTKRRSPEQSADPSVARESAIRLLARREHSRLELEQKLQQRGFLRSVIDPLLDELADENLQSDERYAESLLRSCSARGYGPNYVQNKARQAGISDVPGLAGVDWCELATAARAKRFGFEDPVSPKDRMKQEQFLQRRGFQGEAIRAAMSATGE